mmetsp:Transcript_107021/g.309542  ORF Transcript_107021/g.309542 Transcript_107021/m.309542 type:complete len:149 (+) Transcript_107021:46-492(+)
MGKQKVGAKKEAKTKEEEDEVFAQVREVQDRLEDLNHQADQCRASIRRCEVESKRSELTAKELEPLPDDSKLYRQVGKMFLLQPKKDMTNYLNATSAMKTVESNQLKQALQKLGEQASSEMNSLKELLGPEKFKAAFGNMAQQGAGGK